MEKEDFKQPQRMNISVMEKVLSDESLTNRKRFFISKDLGVTNEFNIFEKFAENSHIGPFVIEDYRFGMIVKGEMESTINLIRNHYKAGDVVYLGRGSIVQLNNISPDFQLKGFVVSPDMVGNIFAYKEPHIITNSLNNSAVTVSESDHLFLDLLILSIWNLVQRESYPARTLYGLLSAAICFYDELYRQACQSESANEETSRKRETFNRFISLVNQHVPQERTLTFYADKLCLSPRYLSTLINEQSGHTAKYWIDEATITRAKVLLKHTSKSVSQISCELQFANDSFFCKFFRRLVGVSPSTYREGNTDNHG